MNLFLKSYRVYFIFFLFITCETCITRAFAQQSDLWLSPWIQEINLPPPYNEIPNETLFRDQQGTLYIGKENGLHIIDGSRISYVHMKGPVHVGSFGSDTLYFVSGNDLGFILRQADGKYHAKSKETNDGILAHETGIPQVSLQTRPFASVHRHESLHQSLGVDLWIVQDTGIKAAAPVAAICPAIPAGRRIGRGQGIERAIHKKHHADPDTDHQDQVGVTVQCREDIEKPFKHACLNT